MNSPPYLIEASTIFSESLFWQLNRDFYVNNGPEVWRDGTVPHHLTSNAMVGKTYAEIIFAFLKDLSAKGHIKEKVYLLELGAGHGRLAFHILKHLERLTDQVGSNLPPFTYILSDMVADNLAFFTSHPQFQYYFGKGMLDVAYYDALESQEILLQHSGTTLSAGDLTQPLLVIANYFFDSLPSDLFRVRDGKISVCSVALHSDVDPKGMEASSVLKNMSCVFQEAPADDQYYEDEVLNDMLKIYKASLVDAYLFFPQKGLACLDNLNRLSQKGLLLLSMDKGFHELSELENPKTPEVIIHGSCSIWVNYHAFKMYCEKRDGIALFSTFPSFYLELGCLLFLPDGSTFRETNSAYQRFVNDFGPDDFNGLKRFTYRHIAKMNLTELISIIRLSAYDSTIFINILPRLKQLLHQITPKGRKRLAHSMHHTWNTYFSLLGTYDLAYEIGGIFYDLGYYSDALTYFASSVRQFGHKEDTFYNKALCHYQLREDGLFVETVKNAKSAFPQYEKFAQLDKLDLKAT